METKKEKLKLFFKQRAYIILVGGASLFYIFRGFINITETGKTVSEIIADFFIAFLFGLSISKLLGMQGVQFGGADERVRATQATHSKTVSSISPKIGELDGWCDNRTKTAIISIRTRILATAGVDYDDFINYYISGNIPPIYVYKNEKYPFLEKLLKWHKVPRLKRLAIKKARRLKITPLTAATLTAEDMRKNDPFALGDDKIKHLAKADAKRVGSKMVFALAVSYYGVQLISNFAISDLIWTTLQMIVFLMFGAMTFMQNYFYMTDTYRFRIIRKIDYLEAFRNDMGIMKDELPVNHSQE